MRLMDWISLRRAEKETRRRLRTVAEAASLPETLSPSLDEPTPTGTYEIVKRNLDTVTGIKQRARSAAKRVISLVEGNPVPQVKK